MSFEISPKPTAEEREALLLALGAQNGAHERSSRWWEAGIREATGADSEENEGPGQASARPRRSAGASRA
jgi:hypothetical protein